MTEPDFHNGVLELRWAASARSLGEAQRPPLGLVGRFLRMGSYVMNDRSGDVSGVDPLRFIDLVWTLRDIKAKRTRLLPVDQDQLRELINLGLVEIRDDAPVITDAGHQVLD